MVNLPGVYLSADMDDEEEVLMAFTAPQVYRNVVTIDNNGCQILYIKRQKTLYDLLKSTLLFYRKPWGDLHAKCFIINPYNPCVANKDICRLQMIIAW